MVCTLPGTSDLGTLIDKLKTILAIVLDWFDRQDKCAILLERLFIEVRYPDLVRLKDVLLEILTEEAHALHIDQLNLQSEEMAGHRNVESLLEVVLAVHDFLGAQAPGLHT